MDKINTVITVDHDGLHFAEVTRLKSSKKLLLQSNSGAKFNMFLAQTSSSGTMKLMSSDSSLCTNTLDRTTAKYSTSYWPGYLVEFESLDQGYEWKITVMEMLQGKGLAND